jgi:hypothetical protein
MTQYVQQSRILIKRSEVSGVVPTIPAGSPEPSNDHTDGTWLATDLYIGEMFINTADDRIWYRSESGIIEISTGSSVDTYVESASLSGHTLTLTRTDAVDVTVDLEDFDVIQFDTTYTETGSEPEGSIYYDADSGFNMTFPNGVILQLGREGWIEFQNNTGSQIDNGSIIGYASSIGNSGKIRGELFLADETSEPHMFIGIATEDVANGATGHATWFGDVRGIQTNGADVSETWSDGDILYVSTTNTGKMTNVKPNAPYPAIPVAVVKSAHNSNGTLLVRPTIPQRLTELVDVNGTPLTTNGQILVWDNDNQYFDFTKNINDYTTSGDVLTTIGQVQDDPTGFVSTTDNTISFNDGTREFSIQPTGSDFQIYQRGELITKTGDTITIPDSEGLHFIYYDNGSIVSTQVFDLAIIRDYVFIAAVYWDATNNVGQLFNERHGHKMPSSVHIWLHEYANAQYSSGGSPTVVDIDGDGDDETAAQISVTEAVITDEDIYNTCAAENATTDVKTIYYFDASGNVRWTTQDDGAGNYFPCLSTGTGRLAYNPEGLGLQEVGNNDYALVHLIALNNGEFGWFVGQADYATLGQARSGIETEAADLYYAKLDNLTAEFVLIASFIFQTSDGYSNSVKSRIRTLDTGEDFFDWRRAKITGTGGINPSDHSLLTNLGNDDHIQYLLTGLGTRSASENVEFNNGLFNGDVTISGDLTVNGTATTVNTQELLVEDNMITLNNGEVGPGVTAGSAGVEIDRGSATNYLFEFNETTDDFRVGESGDTQAVATREDTPTDNGVAFWNDTNNKFETSSLFTWDGTDLTVNSLNIANGGNEINSISTNMFLNYNNGRDVYIGYGTSKGDLFVGGLSDFNDIVTIKNIEIGDGANGNQISPINNKTLNINPDGTTGVFINWGTSTQPVGIGYNLIVRDTVTINDYTLPSADGTNGQVITTDGSGNTSWTDQSGGVSGSGTISYLARWQGSDTLGQSVIYDNGDSISIGMSPLANTKLSVESSETSVNTYAILGRASTTNSQDNTGVLAQALLGDNNIGVQSSIGSAITNFGTNNNYAYVGNIVTFTQGDTNTLFYGVNNTSNSGDNYGFKIDVTNAGTGNGYIGQLKDGSEGSGKVLTCIDANGTATWEDVTATAAGSDDYIQYNKTGGLAGSSTFTYSTADGLYVDNNVLVTGQVVSQQHTADAISSATTINWDSSNSCELTLSASTTLTLNNPVSGGTYFIKIIQEGSFTITWPSTVKWPGGTAPTITTGNDSVDTVVLYFDGTNYFANFAQNYS